MSQSFERCTISSSVDGRRDRSMQSDVDDRRSTFNDDVDQVLALRCTQAQHMLERKRTSLLVGRQCRYNGKNGGAQFM